MTTPYRQPARRSNYINTIDKNSLSYPLTDTDIKNIVPCKIVLYSELENYENINDIFGNNDLVALLYLIESGTSGHWTALIRRPETILYFDSYGEFPDEVLDHLSERIKTNLKEKHNYLTRLILNSGYDCDFNNYQLQELAPGINTCGRFVAARLKFPELSTYNFALLFRHTEFNNPDELITAYTNNILNNLKRD